MDVASRIRCGLPIDESVCYELLLHNRCTEHCMSWVHACLQAAYIRVPQSARRAMAERQLPFREGLHAASHALINVVPLFLLCNSTDLGAECDNPYDTRFRPERLLLFDKHPGGIGLARQVRWPFAPYYCLLRNIAVSDRVMFLDTLL